MPWLKPEELLQVEKPSRYLGREWNAVHKDPSAVDLSLALVFPDLYDLALGNLGLQILYHVLNELPWAWAERVYAPAPDLEAALRRSGRPLASLDSGRPLADFDGVGFTLQSELTYTNVLNMLDLGGVPLRAERRGEGDPLVFAGGPNTVNPEPLAPFMDFFVVGDGEEVVLEIAALLRSMRGSSRLARLEALAAVQGVYVPALAPVSASTDGVLLVQPGATRVHRRVLTDLEHAAYPLAPILPFTGLIHDRVAIEVLRGCTRGCRFCQAGATTRPVRERSPEKIVELMVAGLTSTGHEEASLLSLSTCDHSRALEMVTRVSEAALPWRASVSLPSIRLDGFSIELANKISDVRRSGLTFAPEAATPRLRSVINKPLDDGQLLELAEQACSAGWDHLKLYFMIGLPTETDEDIEAIADLSARVLRHARSANRRARINLGVSTFVPKAWTPFQWAEQIDREETRRRQALLRDALGRNRAIRFGRHDADESWIEGLLARGDRRVADLIERAWSLGCRFDAWSEHRRTALWERALEEVGYDPRWSSRQRDPQERLPWDHIDPGLDPAWLLAEWQHASEGATLADCRDGGCHACGVRDASPAACATMLRDARAARAPSPLLPEPVSAPAPADPSAPAPVPAMRLMLRTARVGECAVLSHHEVMSAWIRALRRARVPLAFTQGFHAHPRVAFDAALPVGEATIDSYVDLLMAERVPLQDLCESIVAQLPLGFQLLGHAEADLRFPSLMSLAEGVLYAIRLPVAPDELEGRIEALLAREDLVVERHGKKGPRTHEVRASIRALRCFPESLDEQGRSLAGVLIGQPPQGSRIRPAELLRTLGVDPLLCSTLRVRTLRAGPAGLEPLGPSMGIRLDPGPQDTDPGAALVLEVLSRGLVTAMAQD